MAGALYYHLYTKKGLDMSSPTTFFILLLLVLSGSAQLQTQKFRPDRAPRDTEVVSNSSTEIACEVDGLQGRVQWTKDGFALGYDRSIPGYPHIWTRGNVDFGEYNLYFDRATLADDGQYQCQVGPAPGHKSLVGTATLTVLVPAADPQIEGYEAGSTVNVARDERSKNLTCSSRNGRPAANLSWSRDGQEILEGIQYHRKDLGNKLEDATSVLQIVRPGKDDNQARYECTATSPAYRLAGGKRSTSVVLSVMYPPGPPRITGYKTGDVVRAGTRVMMKCISEGGNPLAQVYWYKNNVQFDFSYLTGNNRAENELELKVEPHDNQATYKCEASNSVTEQPISTEVTLTVYFPPENVIISGITHAKSGETIHLSCQSGISNPPAKVAWITRGQTISGSTPEVRSSIKGGFVTVANISVTLSDRENDIIYECHAYNEEVGTRRVRQVTLKVMYPPENVDISGYSSGDRLIAGKIHKLMCRASGGNPPAVVTWWRGDKMLTATSTTIARIVRSELSFIVQPQDNGISYRCNATNPASASPLLKSVLLSVSFPPTYLNLSTSPSEIRVGDEVTVTCRSSASNPASRLIWLKDGAEVVAASSRQEAAEFNALSTVSTLKLTAGADLHRQIYSCRAGNNLLQQAVHDAVTFNILYKPVLSSHFKEIFNVEEGKSAIINISVKANPEISSFGWFRNGEKLLFGEDGPRVLRRRRRDLRLPKFTARRGLLNMTEVTKNEAGEYAFRAANTEGESEFRFRLNVRYPAKVTRVSSNALVEPGATATLECSASANPAAVFNWTRSGYDMRRATVVTSGGTSTMTVVDVSKLDSGIFVCEAFNGIGRPHASNVALVVKYRPEVDDSEVFSKAATEKGGTVTLTCAAHGAPAVEFIWLKNKAELNVSSGKYTPSSRKVSLLRYESQFLVRNVSEQDYGDYECVASNELGTDRRLVLLDATSKPDAPTELRLVNATSGGVLVSWTAGFDGGLTQDFQLRHHQVGATGDYRYTHVTPPGSTWYSLEGLLPATQYELSVRARNKLGESAFSEDSLIVQTSDEEPEVGAATHEDDTPLIVILTVSMLGLLLLALNVLLIVCFIKRRRKKLDKDSSDSTSQANTVEMFGATTVAEDSKSFSTFGRRSIVDDFHDEEDEMKQFIGPSSYVEALPSREPCRRSYPYNGVPPSYLNGSLSRVPPPPNVATEHFEPDYVEQLRSKQLQTLLSGELSPAGGAVRPYTKMAPVPPTRSSSRNLHEAAEAAEAAGKPPNGNPRMLPRYVNPPPPPYGRRPAVQGHAARPSSRDTLAEPDSLGHLV